MAECKLSVSFPNSKPDEKICKYSYISWCQTCERESPRRRTMSETLEPCRRKGKEMKTLTPKKYDRRKEYENIELEYEGKDIRFDCCRVRANLCELPTTYITNNTNVTQNASNKVSNNLEYCENNYEKTCKSETEPNLGNMNEKIRPINKTDLMKTNDLSKSISILELKSPSKNPFQITKRPQSVNPSTFYLNSTHITRNSSQEIPNNIETNRPKSILTKHRTFSETKDSNFDTCTFFDKQFDTLNLKERYSKEIECLRQKLHELRDHRAMPKPKTPIYNLDRHTEKHFTNTKLDDYHDIKIIENVVDTRIDGNLNFMVPKTSPVHKKRNDSKTKISIKVKSTSKLNTVKIRKKKHSKIPNSLSTDLTTSDSEASDKELLSLEDEEFSLNEEIYTPPQVSTRKQSLQSSDGEPDGVWPLRESLFPNIPPYIKFTSHCATPNKLPAGRRFLKWKLSTITPIVVRKTLTNTGFRLVRKSNEWLGTWGKHMKSPMFRTLKNNQKLNHFAGTFQIGRKDRLWKNLQRLIHRHGLKEFGIIPHTYILPQDLKLLKQNWEHKNGSGGEKWIIKPPASARGVGIKVINKWSQLPKHTSLVVQRYISDPYLINGSKFDLRLYVLVTSFNPLRIYLYPDGLARFASAKYSDDDNYLKDKYMHLTNYSINKLSSQYTANEDANACQGHKWTISKLWEYMETQGLDTKQLWRNLKQLVIKTIICAESPITQLCLENLNSRYNCYELFGVDVLLDERLKPWLLEVNISPSLHSQSPLDLHVKGPLVEDIFNMSQFHLPQKLGKTVPNCPPCYEPKIYTTTLTKKERSKHNYFTQCESRDEYLDFITKDLTGDDVRYLTQAEDEFVVKGGFERIFPTSKSYKYLEFVEPRYYNRLFDAWEQKYEKNRSEGIKRLQGLCTRRVHLKVAPPTTSSKSSLSQSTSAALLSQATSPVHPSAEGQSHPTTVTSVPNFRSSSSSSTPHPHLSTNLHNKTDQIPPIFATAHAS